MSSNSSEGTGRVDINGSQLRAWENSTSSSPITPAFCLGSLGADVACLPSELGRSAEGPAGALTSAFANTICEET